MTFAGLEEGIRDEALLHFPDRVEALETGLRTGEIPEFRAKRELRYLERLLEADPGNPNYGELDSRLRFLRRRLRLDPAPPGPSAAAGSAASRFSAARPSSAYGAAQSGAAAVTGRAPGSTQANGYPRANAGAAAAAAGAARGAAGGYGAAGGNGVRGSLPPTGSGSAEAVAQFLRRDRAAENAALAQRAAAHFDAADEADEVRLLCAEGQLAQELNRYPVLTAPGTQSALIFRVRSWNEEDDADEARRERLSILELTQATANLREMTEYVAAQVEASQAPLDQVEQDVARANEKVEEGVQALAAMNTSQTQAFRTWIAPSICVVVLGAGASAVGGAVVAGKCAAYVAVKAALAVGALGGTKAGTKAVSDWQQRALDTLSQDLPRALARLEPSLAQTLAAAGREAERRLLAKLDDEASWTTHWNVTRGTFVGAPFLGLWSRERPSDVRKDGVASATRFTSKMEASRAFLKLQRLTLSGSLDPNCQLNWSRPVDGEDGTTVRYFVFSKKFVTRDFHCVTRCGRVAGPGPERYVCATVSLVPELLAETGLPASNQDVTHGTIHVAGVLVTANRDGNGCVVDVMADVDADAPVTRWLADRDVRQHVFSTAVRMQKELS